MNKTQSSTLFLVVEALSPRRKKGTERRPSAWLVGVSCSSPKQKFEKKFHQRKPTDPRTARRQTGCIPSTSRAPPCRLSESNKHLRLCHQRHRFVEHRNTVSPSIFSPLQRGPSTCGEHIISREPRHPEQVRLRTLRPKKTVLGRGPRRRGSRLLSAEALSASIEADTTRRVHERRRFSEYLQKTLTPHGQQARVHHNEKIILHLQFTTSTSSSVAPSTRTGLPPKALEKVSCLPDTQLITCSRDEVSRLILTSKPVVRECPFAKVQYAEARAAAAKIHTHTRASGWVAGWHEEAKGRAGCGRKKNVNRNQSEPPLGRDAPPLPPETNHGNRKLDAPDTQPDIGVVFACRSGVAVADQQSPSRRKPTEPASPQSETRLWD